MGLIPSEVRKNILLEANGAEKKRTMRLQRKYLKGIGVFIKKEMSFNRRFGNASDCGKHKQINERLYGVDREFGGNFPSSKNQRL